MLPACLAHSQVDGKPIEPEFASQGPPSQQQQQRASASTMPAAHPRPGVGHGPGSSRRQKLGGGAPAGATGSVGVGSCKQTLPAKQLPQPSVPAARRHATGTAEQPAQRPTAAPAMQPAQQPTAAPAMQPVQQLAALPVPAQQPAAALPPLPAQQHAGLAAQPAAADAAPAERSKPGPCEHSNAGEPPQAAGGGSRELEQAVQAAAAGAPAVPGPPDASRRQHDSGARPAGQLAAVQEPGTAQPTPQAALNPGKENAAGNALESKGPADVASAAAGAGRCQQQQADVGVQGGGSSAQQPARPVGRSLLSLPKK